MTSLVGRNVRMALKSIKSTKLRSFLTMLGIVIGVASVIVAVSLGEGLRQQIAGGLKTGGPDVISVRPGKLVSRDSSGKIVSVNYQAALSGSSLSDHDLMAIKKLPEVSRVSPLSTISALAKTQDGHQLDSVVIGVSGDFAALVGQKVKYGDFFSDNQSNQDMAIIGQRVAENLFNENVPIGQIVMLRNHEFIVGGVFDDFSANLLNSGNDLNEAIFIPYGSARAISSNSASVYQILAESKDKNPAAATKAITAALNDTHGDQPDFTVLTQAETLQLTRKTLTIATSFIAGIAAISLIVGGIGIMNIMFVSVTERTREIGVRKSLGATNRQIYSQFLIEATIMSLVGGIIGVLIALFVNYCLRVFSSLAPVATWPIVGISVLVAMIVGIVFGTAPAIKAARKDPIQSLRYE